MLKKSKTTALAITLIIGIIIGALFYPSKTIIKEVEVDKQSTLDLVEKLKKEVNTLETSNRKLKQTITSHTTITQNSDGSVVTVIDSQTDTEEFESKIREIEEKFTREIALKDQEIEKLKEFSKVEINKRRVGIELGYLINIQSYYLHTQADLFGPLFVGVQLQAGLRSSIGFGIGFKF